MLISGRPQRLSYCSVSIVLIGQRTLWHARVIVIRFISFRLNESVRFGNFTREFSERKIKKTLLNLGPRELVMDVLAMPTISAVRTYASYEMGRKDHGALNPTDAQRKADRKKVRLWRTQLLSFTLDTLDITHSRTRPPSPCRCCRNWPRIRRSAPRSGRWLPGFGSPRS